MAQNSSSRHSGHRDRLRKKALEHGMDVLENHEVLELLLFYAIPRRNTNEIAHALMDQFGSLSGVFTAEESEMEKINGISKKTAFFLHYLREFWELSDDPSRGKKRVRLNSSSRWITFYQRALYQQTQNMVLLAFLDQSFYLLGTQVLWEGRGAPNKENEESCRTMMRQALMKNAAYAVMVRYQAQSEAYITPQDEETVQLFQAMLNNLTVVLMDYVVLGSDFSFRSMLMSRDQLLLEE